MTDISDVDIALAARLGSPFASFSDDQLRQMAGEMVTPLISLHAALRDSEGHTLVCQATVDLAEAHLAAVRATLAARSDDVVVKFPKHTRPKS